MKINKVTITGADDKVKLADLVNLSKEFPFLEWGILFSASKVGTPRYPVSSTISFWHQQATAAGMNLSAHLCGLYSKRVIEGGDFELISNLGPAFKRVQLNYNFEKNKKDFDLYDLQNLMKYAAGNPQRDIILQYNKSNESTIALLFTRDVPTNVHFLYDSSGGRGTVIKRISPPFDNNYTGYSGGLNPNNIEGVIQNIGLYNPEISVWIDIESGVRTDDQFDMYKVKQVLTTAAKYMNVNFQDALKNNKHGL